MRIQTPTMFNFVMFAAIAFAVTVFLFGEANKASAEFDSMSSHEITRSVHAGSMHAGHR